jgi:hypothetical protein
MTARLMAVSIRIAPMGHTEMQLAQATHFR